MKRNAVSSARTGRKSTLVWALIGILTLLAGGCSLGPIDFGGTPAASPTPQASPTSTVPPPTPTPPMRSLTGKVEDAYTGQPVAGAEVTAAGILTQTTADGSFWFDALPEVVTVTVRTEGYSPAEANPGKSNVLSLKLRPNTLSGRVTDAAGGQPLAGVLVKLVLPQPAPAAPITGTITGTLEVTATVEATATTTSRLPAENKQYAVRNAGYRPSSVVRRPSSSLLSATLKATQPPGKPSPTQRAAAPRTPREVLPTNTPAPTNTPVPPTATPTPKPIPPTGEGFVAVYTDENGSYFFKDVPEGASLTFKMPGYRLTRMPVGEAAKKDVALEVFKAEAIYVTAPFAATPELFDELVQFIENSRINAIVINVQNDNSEWVYDTKNPTTLEAKNTSEANDDVYIPQLLDMVKALKDKGIYTIARLVTFQQPTMAKARPDLAVKSSATGKVWIGGELSQQAWLDASIPAAQDYVLDMTREVLTLGFDEIQYDYVRFPSDPAPNEPGKPVFSQPLTGTQKADFISAFLQKAHAVIEPSDAFMSIDIFGYTLWPDRGGEPLNAVIGQVFEKVVDHTDYVCPMIYPSHFTVGEQGCKVPAACAYELVHKAGEFAIERFAGKRAKYRPWLQDFDWYGTDYTSPGTTKVIDQIRAAAETNAWGWQMWDPWNAYDPRGAFK